MNVYDDGIQEENLVDKFWELFSELEYSNKIEQKQKIEEMNKVICEIGRDELFYIFTKELFCKIEGFIEEEKLTMENAILLLKHVGYYNVLKTIWIDGFETSSLDKRIEKMIVAEEKKKEGKNENLLVDLCECYLLLNNRLSSKLISICVSCIVKVGLKKEEKERTQKEEEIAFLALNHYAFPGSIEQELLLNAIKKIIQCHQEHHDLTQFVYQSAWDLLIGRLNPNKSLEGIIVDELHFPREAKRELEVLSKCVEWKRTEEEKGGKETKEEQILLRWLRTLNRFLDSTLLWSEEHSELIRCVVQIFRVSRDNHREISKLCIHSLREVAASKAVKAETLLECEAIDVILEEILQSTLSNSMKCDYLRIFLELTGKLREEQDDEIKEAKRKATKRKVFEKMEKEGYEDIITSFQFMLEILSTDFDLVRGNIATGVCTNGIEGLWSRFRQYLPKTGVNNKFIDDYIASYMFHSSRKYSFIDFVKKIIFTVPKEEESDDSDSNESESEDESLTPLVDDLVSSTESDIYGAGDGEPASEYAEFS
ncbi:uncharacterized protein MONOS_5697 [Monocercomonoides exilis]|uniref:uncharacterized protein n=1 Tax=Monocercomonoides exilis TaxID=2049356 RepID=UPI00355A57DE|nr:hypothetical protein MONOS_5697 [Monocercomonoides exilis]|eukprot:MONOS_5697.1-p1 / transcript=MONOS_5697.1 / gene=MONOS_5697 / organism=Monocercomonoides_exilis_PA203 / gene_product=unspecified product / transcript_product=unspecified product / location=Mono_scaffold00169:63788-66273(-) / protein_length=540 / sequence_SO=supercontig / SO=protein_coding / is_pseudo=false